MQYHRSQLHLSVHKLLHHHASLFNLVLLHPHQTPPTQSDSSPQTLKNWRTVPHPPLCLSWHNNNRFTVPISCLRLRRREESRTANWQFRCPIPHYLIIRIRQRLSIPYIPVEYLLHRPLSECTALNTTPWNCMLPWCPLPPECRCTFSRFRHLWKPPHCPWKCLAPTSLSLWIL